MDSFEVEQKDYNTILLDLLFHSCAQNAVILDTISIVLSHQLQVPIEDINAMNNDKLNKEVQRLKDLIFENYGAINIKDILGRKDK